MSEMTENLSVLAWGAFQRRPYVGPDVGPDAGLNLTKPDIAGLKKGRLRAIHEGSRLARGLPTCMGVPFVMGIPGHSIGHTNYPIGVSGPALAWGMFSPMMFNLRRGFDMPQKATIADVLAESRSWRMSI